MAPEPTTPPPQARQVWGAAALLLLSGFLFGGWMCRMDASGADAWSLGNVLLLAGSVGMMTFGLLGLRALTRRMMR
jgi:hypothetical protein